MNRAFAIILVPAFLVAIGYVVVFRYSGVAPAYWRLIAPMVLLGGALLWLARKQRDKRSNEAGK